MEQIQLLAWYELLVAILIGIASLLGLFIAIGEGVSSAKDETIWNLSKDFLSMFVEREFLAPGFWFTAGMAILCLFLQLWAPWRLFYFLIPAAILPTGLFWSALFLKASVVRVVHLTTKLLQASRDPRHERHSDAPLDTSDAHRDNLRQDRYLRPGHTPVSVVTHAQNAVAPDKSYTESSLPLSKEIVAMTKSQSPSERRTIKAHAGTPTIADGAPPSTAVSPSVQASPPQRPRAFSYDVALSFAGEDRTHAEALAALLKDKGIRVFYDRYEQADLWGKDLYQHLQTVYRDRARYCVVLVSSAYARKLWTRHELQQAQARAFAENAEYILPIRFDDTALPGLNSTIGYLDGRTHTTAAIVDMLLRKLDEPHT